MANIYEKLSIKELFSMKVNDQFRVYWAKDDDPSDIRCKPSEVQTIESITSEDIVTDSFNWLLSGVRSDMSITDNQLDTTRGIAYFYKK